MFLWLKFARFKKKSRKAKEQQWATRHGAAQVTADRQNCGVFFRTRLVHVLRREIAAGFSSCFECACYGGVVFDEISSCCRCFLRVYY